jgi:CRISPR-associated Csx10 family RAMP protein
MIRLQLIATALTPLQLSGTHEVGNVNTSLDYITGTSVRGACAARFLAHGDPVDETFYQLFCSENVRFENLYPAHVDSVLGTPPVYSPSQPSPQSVRTCKGYSGFFSNRRGEADQHGTTDTLFGTHQASRCPICQAALTNLSGFYFQDRIDRDWHDLRPVSARSLITMHNEIENTSQRSREGILFTFDGKDRQQVFIGSIYLMEDSADTLLANFAEKLAVEDDSAGGQQLLLSVGKRRTARGTIAVQLSTFQNQVFPDPDLIYEDFDERFESLTNAFTITLFSDAIVTDRWLRYQTALTAEVLADEMELGAAHHLDLVKPLFCSSRQISGWNDAHKLPKVDEIAIEKGASFRYRFSGDAAQMKEKLRKLEIEGIGYRRNEGFGRLIVNHPFHRRNIDIFREEESEA